MHIIIVGAGIVGLSIARSTLDRGHQVTLLDQAAIPNPDGASYDEHRLIRYQYAGAEGYARMVGEALQAWNGLWQQIGACHFADSGVLSISLRTGDYADTSLATLRRAGLPHEVLCAVETERLAPQLALPSHAVGVLCRPGGALFADRIVRDLATLVRSKGARVLAGSRVVAVDETATTVRTQRGETIAGDIVIVAAGVWLDKLLPEYTGLPAQRQMLCYVEPPPRHKAAWDSGPALCVIGDNNVYTLPPRDCTGLKFGCGALRQTVGPEQGGFEPDLARGRLTIEAFRPFLREEAGYRVVRGKVGYYVMDAERCFKLHKRGSRLVVTNCDGQMFKFGALIGERIAAMLDGEQAFDATARWMAGHI